MTEGNAKNFVAFLLDTPIENAYATLLPLKSISQFTTNTHMKNHVLENKELVSKIKEARIAKDAFKASKEEREKKSKKKLDDVPF